MIYFNKYSFQNLRKYYFLIKNLQTFNFEYDQYLVVNKKLKLINEELNEISETLNYQIIDNSTNQQSQIEELNNLDHKYPISQNSDYFNLLKNQNNFNLKNKNHKIITQNIDQIENENKLLTNTINNCQKYLNLIQTLSGNNEKNIQLELKIFFTYYQKYFLLNFINQKIINKSIKNIKYTQEYKFNLFFLLTEIFYLMISIHILIFIFNVFFSYHLL